MGQLIILEGFTHWDINDARVKWDTVNNYNAMTISAEYGRNGSGMSLNTGGTSVGHQVRVSYPGSAGAAAMFEKYFPADLGEITTVNIGFALKLNDVELGYPIPIVALIDLSETDTYIFTSYYRTQVSLLLTPQQQLVFCTGNHLDIPPLIFNNYSPPLKRGVFSFIEIQITVGNPGSVQLWIDGKSVVGDSGNTQPTGTPSFGGVRFFHHLSFSPNYVRNYQIDDIYVFVNGGTRFNDNVVEVALPTSDGALRQWTPSTGTLNYDMVNELSPNDDIDYNLATAAGNEDTYNYPSLANTSGTVHGMTINAVGMNAEISAAGSIMVTGIYRQGGINYLAEPAQQIGTIIYHANVFGFTTNPATGNRFSISEINAAELGIKRVT